MKIWVISFTGAGAVLAERIKQSLIGSGEKAETFLKMKHPSQMQETKAVIVRKELSQWTEKAFASADAILFVGACGIAVRSIAPYVRDKFTDPAVLVMDELGQHCISLLSGHVGGANELCVKISSAVGAVPVITTATDINRRFAVDVFAAKNRFAILDRQMAKEVSAAILAGLEIPVYCEKNPGQEEKPEHFSIRILSESDISQRWELGIYIGIHFNRSPFEKTLYLVPKAVSLGIGCKAGTGKNQIEDLADTTLKASGIFPEAVKTVASIELKKGEQGLIAYCKDRSIPFVTFSAEELLALSGDFHGSGFVEQVTGVDNVCERSACHAAGLGVRTPGLIIEKQVENGVTFAAAEEEWRIRYE